MSSNYNLHINWVVEIPLEGSPTVHQLRLVGKLTSHKHGFSTIHTVVFSPDFWLPSTVCLCQVISHTIHAWYIHLHLVDFYGFHVGKFTMCPMDPMGILPYGKWLNHHRGAQSHLLGTFVELI